MRNLIIDAARNRIGTPFKHQGRKAKVGLDCIGLIVNVLSEFMPDIIKHDCPNYSPMPYRNHLKENLERIFQQTSIPQIADILLLKYGRYPQHVGFFTGSSIIHAYATVGKVIESSIYKDDCRIVAYYNIGVCGG